MFTVRRSPHNPLFSPDPKNPWEAHAVFNWSPALIGGTLHLLYRAESEPDLITGQQSVSVIGKTTTTDGLTFNERQPFITPQEEWERYGCEDPRVTFFEGTYYIFYTALSTYPFGPEGIKVAVATSRDLKKVSDRHLVTFFNAKAMSLFPERIDGKLWAFVTVHPDQPPSHLGLISFDSPEQIWSEDHWGQWYTELDKHIFNLKRSDNDQVEIGAPPVLTDAGWLLIYSHIQNYFSDNKIFGIEAVLLDSNNPTKIIGRTNSPIMVPEEIYEHYGHVPNVIFPSGSLRRGNDLEIYYGATDMTCATARINTHDLLASLEPESNPLVSRTSKPILKPRKRGGFEELAVFNPAAFELDGNIHILYRAMSLTNTSSIGLATSKDGIHIDERLSKPIYTPHTDLEAKKHDPNGNSGAEDPRATVIGDTLYVTYTAYDQELPRVALISLPLKDFKAHNFTWTEPVIISPPNVDDKDACLFPAQFAGKYLFIHRVKNWLCADYLDTLNPPETADECIRLIGPRPGMWDSAKVGVSAPPIRTEEGWLLLYHGVSDQGIYQVGAALLDLEEPTKVIGRTNAPIMTPELKWEREGVIPNVVFPCGAVRRDNDLFLYYGGADTVVGVATLDLPRLLKILTA
jgi:predicted GH43/DUF377 family glycosyl hydrolase